MVSQHSKNTQLAAERYRYGYVSNADVTARGLKAPLVDKAPKKTDSNKEFDGRGEYAMDLSQQTSPLESESEETRSADIHRLFSWSQIDRISGHWGRFCRERPVSISVLNIALADSSMENCSSPGRSPSTTAATSFSLFVKLKLFSPTC